MTDNNAKNGIEIKKDIKDISLFKDDKYCLFVYKKTIKLSAGLYVVTNLLSDEEPLKWELRRYGQKLLSSTVIDSNFSQFPNYEISKMISKNCLVIVSILDVAFYAGLISEMNYTILKDEFTEFVIFLDGQPRVDSNFPEVLDRRFFELPKEHRFSGASRGQEKYSRKLASPEDGYKGHSIRQGESMSYKNGYSGLKSETKNSVNNKGQNTSSLQKNDQKSLRKDSIISILKNNIEPLTIKDISNNIKDCSEKTIQRELLSMVASGVLKKEGERRWSRYSLIVA